MSGHASKTGGSPGFDMTQAQPGAAQSPGLGHMHLNEHLTGDISNVGMGGMAGGPTTAQPQGPQAAASSAYGYPGGQAQPGGEGAQSHACGGKDAAGAAGHAQEAQYGPQYGGPYAPPMYGPEYGPQYRGPYAPPMYGPEYGPQYGGHPSYGPAMGAPYAPQQPPFPQGGPAFMAQAPGGPQFMAQGQPYGGQGGSVCGGHGQGGEAYGPMPGASGSDQAQMFGHMSGIASDLMQGRSPNPQQVMGVLESCSSQFWKGAVVGAGLAMLLSNSAVKDALGGLLNSATSGFGGDSKS